MKKMAPLRQKCRRRAWNEVAGNPGYANVCARPDMHPGAVMRNPFKPESEDEAGGFVQLLIEIQPQLRSFIGHLMPIPDSRPDLLQEVNMLLWKKRKTFRMSADCAKEFRNWAYTIARYVVMNQQKRARRESKLVFGDEVLDKLACDFEESDPGIAERIPALRRCLRKIPENERDLLLERYTRHGAVEHRAREDDRSAAALRGVLFRLRVALRRCVEHELQQSPEA